MCLGPVMGSPGGVTRLQGTVFLLLLANFNNCLDQIVDCYTGLSKLKLKLAQEKQKKKARSNTSSALCGTKNHHAIQRGCALPEHAAMLAGDRHPSHTVKCVLVKVVGSELCQYQVGIFLKLMQFSTSASVKSSSLLSQET